MFHTIPSLGEMTKFRRRALGLDRQLGLLKLRDPAGHGEIRGGKLVWRWEAQPTPVSRRYFLRLEQARGLSPRVFVEQPSLSRLADSRPIPHLYSQHPAQLCLYLPDSGEWSGTMALANTLVPWSSFWLYYFEEWLASDEWRGGGVHPPSLAHKEYDAKRRDGT